MIQRAADLPREQWPQDGGRPKPLSAEQEAMVDLLHAALRLIAAQHQLSPLAIASRKDLEQLVRGETKGPLNEGWRGSLAGQTLRRVMHGEIALEVRGGGLELTGTGGSLPI